MTNTVQLNIIPFTPKEEEVEFAFYSEKKPGFAPIHWQNVVDKRPAEWPANYQYFYTNFKPAEEGAIVKKIELEKSIDFAQHYFRYLILNYFKAIEGAVIFPNFIKDVEIWFKDNAFQNDIYNLYHNYTIKIQYGKVSAGFELVLSYNGTSKILKQSFNDIEFSSDIVNLLNCSGIIFSQEHLPEHYKLHMEKLFPVVNYDIMKELNIPFPEPVFENRYPKYLKILNDFCKTYLNTTAFKSIINLSKDGFIKVNRGMVFQTSDQSNELLFGKGWDGAAYQTDINPGKGMYVHGPHRPSPHPHVKFLFIYHKPDGKLIADTIHKYFSEGYQGTVNNTEKKFKKMRWYIKQHFDMPKNLSISFDNIETLYDEVAPKIKAIQKNPNTRYVAIYISPINKGDPDETKHHIYYRLKELLLNEQITSQVIYREHLEKPEFYYFLPNIEIAMLAKIDGIPWRLNREKADEIVIGVGAFYSISRKKKFVGSAFCFSNEGRFEGFDCFGADETEMLAGSIRDAVDKFISKNKDAKRVIIHFYKVISDERELKPIMKMLGKLGHQDLPVIVVTINKTESKELLGFDTANGRKMPYSGTYVKVGYNQYLLFNNTYYKHDSEVKDKEHHFPIKISIRSSVPELVEDVYLVRDLIDQVYQFSRMYWKSVSQQNLPVTIKYPEMVAKIYPYFEDDKLPDFGKENLWFL